MVMQWVSVFILVLHPLKNSVGQVVNCFDLLALITASILLDVTGFPVLPGLFDHRLDGDAYRVKAGCQPASPGPAA